MTDICPHDNKPCYVGRDDDKHFRCGTAQCGSMTADRAPNDVVVRIRRHLDRATQDWDSRDDAMREAADALEAAIERERKLREAIQHVRAIIVDGAQEGFNYKYGDWVKRLFASQAITRAALADSQPKQEQT